MGVHIYRYGEAGRKKGLFVGATRYLPRGVRREDYATRGYFDVWFPLLAPSPALMKGFLAGRLSYAQFGRKYRTEMNSPEARQAIRLLAATAVQLPVHVGCFCEDPARCHRSLLLKLILAADDALPKRAGAPGMFSSPACAMPEIED